MVLPRDLYLLWFTVPVTVKVVVKIRRTDKFSISIKIFNLSLTETFTFDCTIVRRLEKVSLLHNLNIFVLLYWRRQSRRQNECSSWIFVHTVGKMLKTILPRDHLVIFICFLFGFTATLQQGPDGDSVPWHTYAYFKAVLLNKQLLCIAIGFIPYIVRQIIHGWIENAKFVKKTFYKIKVRNRFCCLNIGKPPYDTWLERLKLKE